MNKNYICVYDYETGGKYANKSQPIQLAAIMLDPKNLNVVKGGEFESLMRPFDDDECQQYGLEPIQDDALKVNHKTREELANAPDVKEVWKKFIDFLKDFYVEDNQWGAPIIAGFNIHNFDNKITERLACGNKLGEKEPYGFGPADDFGAKVFHPIHSVDVLPHFWSYYENVYDNELRSLSMDNLRKYSGMISENAHDALQDVKDCSEFLIRILKMNREYLGPRFKFKNSCKERKLKTL